MSNSIDFKKYPYLANNGNIPYAEPGDTFLDCVPEGWRTQFFKTMDCINEVITEYGFHPERFQFLQVKEKFGELRIYWEFNGEEVGEVRADGIREYISLLIEELADKTRKICHKCGKPATLLSTGWVLPYCGECAAKHNAECNVRHKTWFTVEQTFQPIK